jgi:hypothetical protein
MDVQQTSRFADRVLRLLERVEYRRADSPADKAAIYRLRHDAYMRAGTVEPRPSGMFHDAMDQKDNAWLIGRTGRRAPTARFGQRSRAPARVYVVFRLN